MLCVPATSPGAKAGSRRVSARSPDKRCRGRRPASSGSRQDLPLCGWQARVIAVAPGLRHLSGMQEFFVGVERDALRRPEPANQSAL